MQHNRKGESPWVVAKGIVNPSLVTSTIGGANLPLE